MATLALLAVIIGAAVVFVGYQTTRTPDPNAAFLTNTSFVYYRDGKTQLGSFALQNRQSIPFSQMPTDVKDAVVAAENRTFWTDPGYSIRGMIRSAWVILRGGEVQGGSTITQQYIKIVYLNSEQTVQRKFKELLLAAKIGRSVPKQQILEGYLNTIYFGRGAYGIQAASKAYFNTDAQNLTVPQAAVLAAVLNSPSQLDPSEDPANVPRLLARYRYVLSSMAELGTLSATDAARDSLALPKFPDIPLSSRYGGPQGFLLKMVENELLSDDFAPSQINGGGLKIVTTFDKSSEDAAIKAAQHTTKVSAANSGQKAKNLHAAIASVQVGTGNVLALYGGPDFVKNSRNWATTDRPTASTFKSYALAAGLENNFSLYSRLNGNTWTPPGDTTPVRNEYSTQYGTVTLLRATADSINTAFVDMTTQMSNGPAKVLQAASDAGVPKGAGWDPTYDRVALGNTEVSPLSQASAYATFANLGTRVAPHVVQEVRNAKNQLLYKAEPLTKRTFPKDVARDVTYALSDVVEEGTGQSVQTLDRPVAAKTGTKDDVRHGKSVITSAWFVGYTRQISTAVMYVAGNAGTDDLDPYKRPGDATFFGGTYPAQTWADYMATASKGLPVEQFDDPAYVNRDSAPDSGPTSTYSAPTSRPTYSVPTSRPTSSATPTQTATTPSSGPTSPAQSSSGPTSSSAAPGPTATRSTSPAPTSKPTSSASTGPPTPKPSHPTTTPGPPNPSTG